MVSPAILARNSSSSTLLRRSGRTMATTSFISLFSQHEDRALAAAVRLLAVLRDVETQAFFARVGAQRGDQREELDDDERAGGAVDERSQHGDALNAELAEAA